MENTEIHLLGFIGLLLMAYGIIVIILKESNRK